MSDETTTQAPGVAPAAKPFDEAAFDAAVAKPNGWSSIPDPVAEIRRMRGDPPPTSPATPEPLSAILAEMRKAVAPMILGRPKIEAVSIRDVLQWADRIEAAAARQNHCDKRFDEDGNEMPPHCAFQSLRLDHALAERDALRKYIEKCRDYFADLTEEYNLEEECKLLEEARALLNETKGE